MNKIILEDRFTTHQKISLLLYIGGPIIIVIAYLIKAASDGYLTKKGYLVLLIFMSIYMFLVMVAFLKKGFFEKDGKLYRGAFFRGKLFFKKHIPISHTPKLAVLKFKKSQKLAWFSAAHPDLSVDFNAFEINILNDKHTKREALMDLKNIKNIEPVVAFLTGNFNLKHEDYCPTFD